MRLTRQGVRDLGDMRQPGASRRVVRPHVIHDGRPRIAVDTGVSDRDCSALDAAGFYVAVVAGDAEPDASWLLRSERALVDIVCSPDREVGIWCYEHDVIFVRLDGNRRTPVLSRVRAAWRNR